MTIPGSWRGIISHYRRLPQDVVEYFQHLPKLLEEFPLDVVLAYLFAQVELAQNKVLYCGVVKIHHAHSELARNAIDAHRMTREGFYDQFKNIFGFRFPESISVPFKIAETIRDKVMHGKQTRAKDKRKAIMFVLEYAKVVNKFLDEKAGFSPFGSLKGFKGRAEALDKSTTRWLLKGMGFNLS